MVAFDLRDHLIRLMTPMLAVYATATVAVTVAAGTRCARYGMGGPAVCVQWMTVIIQNWFRRFCWHLACSSMGLWCIRMCFVIGVTRWDILSYAAKQHGQAMAGACSRVMGAGSVCTMDGDYSELENTMGRPWAVLVVGWSSTSGGCMPHPPLGHDFSMRRPLGSDRAA